MFQLPSNRNCCYKIKIKKLNKIKQRIKKELHSLSCSVWSPGKQNTYMQDATHPDSEDTRQNSPFFRFPFNFPLLSREPNVWYKKTEMEKMRLYLIGDPTGEEGSQTAEQWVLDRSVESDINK